MALHIGKGLTLRNIQKKLYLTIAIAGVATIAVLASTNTIHFIYLPVYALASIISFVMYWIDKQRAKANAWRTSELALQLSGFFCGWPGALAAQVLVRHKNKKITFQLVFWLLTAANVTFLFYIAKPA